MRLKFRIKFQLCTLGLLAVLMAANVATYARPSWSHASGGSNRQALPLATVTSIAFGRGPASDERVPAEAPSQIRVVQIGCEPNLRLRFEEHVKQVRLQFDTCKVEKADSVFKVHNRTNGFEATVFGIEPRLPASAGARASTDYLSLTAGQNEIVIQRTNRTQLLKIERI